jgi:hypothetical protein
MTKKKTETQDTLVTFLLDRSSSMSSCWDSTIEAFNGYVGTLKDAKTPILFTFLQFDHNGGICLDKVHFEKPIKDVPDISKATYQPRGSTPLIEAAMKTIQALDAAVATKKTKPKVVVCIQTDGEENSSGREYTWAGLKALIEAKTKEGWQFNFMGAGIDAYDQGQKMGIAAMSTMSYDQTDKVATRAAFAASASNTMEWGAGLRADTTYTMAQRSASGDRFAHRAQQQTHVPLATPILPAVPVSMPLDLTTGGSASVPLSTSLDLTTP